MTYNTKRRLATLAIATLLIAVGSIRVAMATEPDRCATIQVNYPTEPYYEQISIDPGLSIARVGHYLWMQNTAEEPSSTEHLVSISFKGLATDGPVMVCTGDTTWFEDEQPSIVQVVDEPTVQEWVVPAPEPRALRVWVPL